VTRGSDKHSQSQLRKILSPEGFLLN
jgi:hypothetical protein